MYTLEQKQKRNADINRRIAIYEYLQANNTGNLQDLENVAGSLFSDMIEKQHLIGYGINSRAEERYHLTKEGASIVKLNLISLRLKQLEYE